MPHKHVCRSSQARCPSEVYDTIDTAKLCGERRRRRSNQILVCVPLPLHLARLQCEKGQKCARMGGRRAAFHVRTWPLEACPLPRRQRATISKTEIPPALRAAFEMNYTGRPHHPRHQQHGDGPRTDSGGIRQNTDKRGALVARSAPPPPPCGSASLPRPSAPPPSSVESAAFCGTGGALLQRPLDTLPPWPAACGRLRADVDHEVAAQARHAIEDHVAGTHERVPYAIRCGSRRHKQSVSSQRNRGDVTLPENEGRGADTDA